jgi:DNA-binding transcriptional ArsR family regulator
MDAQQLLPISFLSDAADCLRLLGHPMRLRMVDILSRGSLPVHEIADLCELPHHQACEHLRLLRGHGLLSSRRDGRAVFYRIADPRLPRLLNCIRNVCENTDVTEIETRKTES